jgi:hypothetical protein
VTLFLKEEPSKMRVKLNAGIIGEIRFDKGCQLDDCALSLEIKCTGESNKVILALVQGQRICRKGGVSFRNANIMTTHL